MPLSPRNIAMLPTLLLVFFAVLCTSADARRGAPPPASPSTVQKFVHTPSDAPVWDGNVSNCYPDNPFGFYPLPPNGTNVYSTQRHSCFTDVDAPCCPSNKSITSDPLCKGVYSNSLEAVYNMSCDYAVITVPASGSNQNTWLASPHSGCDDGVDEVSDFLSTDMNLNYWKIAPCKGISRECMPTGSFCDAVHVSWTRPGKPNTGLNEAGITKIYNSGAKILWMHSTTTDYVWVPNRCSTDDPIIACIVGDNAEMDAKFDRMKALLESYSNTKYMPCSVLAVDARGAPPSPVQNISIPCSGAFPKYGATNIGWEIYTPFYDALIVAMHKEAKAKGGLKKSKYFDALREAVRVALE